MLNCSSFQCYVGELVPIIALLFQGFNELKVTSQPPHCHKLFSSQKLCPHHYLDWKSSRSGICEHIHFLCAQIWCFLISYETYSLPCNYSHPPFINLFFCINTHKSILKTQYYQNTTVVILLAQAKNLRVCIPVITLLYLFVYMHYKSVFFSTSHMNNNINCFVVDLSSRFRTVFSSGSE